MSLSGVESSCSIGKMSGEDHYPLLAFSHIHQGCIESRLHAVFSEFEFEVFCILYRDGFSFIRRARKSSSIKKLTCIDHFKS